MVAVPLRLAHPRCKSSSAFFDSLVAILRSMRSAQFVCGDRSALWDTEHSISTQPVAIVLDFNIRYLILSEGVILHNTCLTLALSDFDQFPLDP